MQEAVLIEKKAAHKEKPELDSFLEQAKACLEDLRAGRVTIVSKKSVTKRKRQMRSPVIEQLKEGLEDLRAGRVDEV